MMMGKEEKVEDSGEKSEGVEILDPDFEDK